MRPLLHPRIQRAGSSTARLETMSNWTSDSDPNLQHRVGRTGHSPQSKASTVRYLQPRLKTSTSVMLVHPSLHLDTATARAACTMALEQLTSCSSFGNQVKSVITGTIASNYSRLLMRSFVCPSIAHNYIYSGPENIIELTLGRPGGVGTTPLAFFPCNFFDDSNRKKRLSVSVTRDGRHILAYVTSSWPLSRDICHDVICTWRCQNTLFFTIVC